MFSNGGNNPKLRLVVALLVGLLWATACRPAQDGLVNQANTPTGGEPQVGGALVIGVPDEPDTLDAHKTAMAISDQIMNFIGASLVTLDPAGQVVPYLAERWQTSADGLTWTFTLKPGITFHDGTPFTAQDYVYTFERALNPETAAAVAGTLLGPVQAVEALDERTLVITLAEPFFPLLINLAAGGYLMPLSQASVQAGGDAYGRRPLSVGPYIFKEWRSGEAIILERNPAFKWGPAFAQAGPYPIERIEFRFLPDSTTLLAALEAGELDQAQIAGRDVDRLRESGRFEIYEAPLAGASPIGAFNVNQPPFDELRVRQAFNLAVNRTDLIRAAVQGQADIQYGPISPAVLGYWPGVEDIGYDYDPERARALLAEAGYRLNAEGILAKAGQPLRFPLLTNASFTADAEILAEQFKAIGAEVSLEVLEQGLVSERFVAGDYHLMLISLEASEADLLYLVYHSTRGMLPGRLSDPDLDAILDKTRSTVAPEVRQEWVNQAQARIVEQAYMLPLYAPTVFTAVSKRVTGLIARPDGSFIYNEARITNN